MANIELLPVPAETEGNPWIGYKLWDVRKLQDYARANMAPLIAEIETLRNEVSWMRAARLAYASEFPATEDGDPDTDNIHANIRALKAENESLRADKADLEAALEYLKVHKENAAMNQDGIIKALSEVRDEQGAEIHRLRAEREVIVAEAVKYADKSGRLEAKVGRLAEALRLARDLVEDWAGYAGEYFQKKHNLEGDLALLDAALRDHDQEGK